MLDMTSFVNTLPVLLRVACMFAYAVMFRPVSSSYSRPYQTNLFFFFFFFFFAFLQSSFLTGSFHCIWLSIYMYICDTCQLGP